MEQLGIELEGGIGFFCQGSLPGGEIACGSHLVIAPTLQDKYPHCQRFCQFGGLVAAQGQPVGRMKVQGQVVRRDTFGQVGVLHARHLNLQFLQLGFLLAGDRAGEVVDVSVLIQDGVLEGACHPRQDDQPGNRRILLPDQGRQRGSQAVTQDKNLPGVNIGVPLQELDCQQRIIDCFFFNGSLSNQFRGKERFMGKSALVVAQHSHTLRGQAPGQVPERFVRAKRLVAVLRP